MTVRQQAISPPRGNPAAMARTLQVRRGLQAAGLFGLAVWCMAHGLLFSETAFALWLPSLLVLLAYLAAVERWMPARYPHAAFGACNAATLMRGVLAAVLVTPLAAAMPPSWAVFGFAATAWALDGIDGWLARRSGLASGFGARFDMETDALLALVLALHAWMNGLAWPLALVLGAARYIFFAAALALPWLSAPLPERFSRKAVCVFQIGVLMVLQTPAAGEGPAAALALAAALAVSGSFARDILWLHRQRA